LCAGRWLLDVHFKSAYFPGTPAFLFGRGDALGLRVLLEYRHCGGVINVVVVLDDLVRIEQALFLFCQGKFSFRGKGSCRLAIASIDIFLAAARRTNVFSASLSFNFRCKRDVLVPWPEAAA